MNEPQANEFWQAVDEGYRRLGRGPDDPALLVMTPATLAHLTQLAAARSINLDRIEVETDPAAPADGVMIVTHRQMKAYRAARSRGAAPALACYEGAFRQAIPDAPDHDWTLVGTPTEPAEPSAIRPSRRRFPIPR